MNDLTTQPPKLSIAYSAAAELTVELAKMLALVAPTSMTVEQQELWLRAAADSLEGIRATEVRDISAEIRRSVTRHNQIVPEIARLVARKRSHSAGVESSPASAEWRIGEEAQKRRGAARGRKEIEAAWEWERDARKAAGLHVEPIASALTRPELDAMPKHVADLGLRLGFLSRDRGALIEST